MGRPPGDAAPMQLATERPVVKRRLVREVWPRAVLHEGVHRTAFGPPKPIYEERENGKGRWGQTSSDDTLWIVRAIEGRGRIGYAAKVARELAEESGRPIVNVEAVNGVKRKLISTRADIKARSKRRGTPRKVPQGISDIPPDK